MSLEQDFNANVQHIFFDYDTYDIRSDAQAMLSKDADWLVSHPDVKVVIGGYCDERGSDEYNLALGQNRAKPPKRRWLRRVWQQTACGLSATARRNPSAQNRLRNAGS